MVMNNILEDYKSQEDLFEEYLEYLFVTGQLDLKADDDDAIATRKGGFGSTSV